MTSLTLLDLRTWVHSILFPSFHKAAILRDKEFELLQLQLKDTRILLQRSEDLLANRNAKATVAQSLVVTDHAVHRYRQRIGFKGSDDELKKMIYKLTIRHLSTMDKLPDGRYDLGKNVIAAVKDNTVTTIVPRGKK